jgi:integrase
MSASKPTTLGAAIGRYLEIRSAKVSGNTFKNDAVALALLVRTLGDRLPLEAFTRELCDEKFFAVGGVATKISPTTFAAYLSRMRQFTKNAAAYGWIPGDILGGMQAPRRPAPKERQRLTPEELLHLVEVARSPRDRVALAIAINTGLRGSEIASIRIGDVDLEAGYMDVLIEKTGDRDRMPITADLALELYRWIDHYRRHSPTGELHDNWYLVPQQNYSPHHLAEDRTMDYKLIPNRPLLQPYDVVKRALVDIGLPTTQEGMHTIRRSVGRAYYNLMKTRHGHESALVATAALLHHKDIRQTQHYIGVQPERAERDEILRGQPFLTRIVHGGRHAGEKTPSVQVSHLRAVR